MTSRRFVKKQSGAFAILAVCVAGCDGGGTSAPSPLVSPLNLTGTWRSGSLSIPDCTLDRHSTLQGTNSELRGPIAGSGCLGPGSVTVVVTRQ
jgi:hypothetical protein